MKISINPILASLVFATLLIASSYFLKGNAIGDWVDAGIYMAWTYCAYRYYTNSPKAC